MKAGKFAAGIGAVGVALVLAALQSSSQAAVKPQRLRTLSVTQRGSFISAVIVVPPLLSRRSVPQSAFRVSEDGAVLSPRVLQLPVTDAELTVLIDAPEASTTTIATMQGAIADFIVHLPAQLPVAVVPAGASSAPTPKVERTEALAVLRDLKAQPPQEMGPALADVLAGLVARDDERSVVLVVSSRSKDLGGDVPAFTPGRPLVYAAVAPAAAKSAVVPLVRQSIGTVTQWSNGDELLRSLDAVSSDIAGQYRVEFETAGLGTPIEVTTDYAGVQAAGRLGLADESEASPSAVPSVDASPGGVGTDAPSPEVTSQGAAIPGASTVPTSIVGPAKPTPGRALSDSTGEKAGGGLGTKFVLGIVVVLAWFAAVGGVALARSRRAGPAIDYWAPERIDPEPFDSSDVDFHAGVDDDRELVGLPFPYPELDLDAEHSALIQSHAGVGQEWAPERGQSQAVDIDPYQAARAAGVDGSADHADFDSDAAVDTGPRRRPEGADESWAPEAVDLPAEAPPQIDLTAAADADSDQVKPPRH